MPIPSRIPANPPLFVPQGSNFTGIVNSTLGNAGTNLDGWDALIATPIGAFDGANALLSLMDAALLAAAFNIGDLPGDNLDFLAADTESFSAYGDSILPGAPSTIPVPDTGSGAPAPPTLTVPVGGGGGGGATGPGPIPTPLPPSTGPDNPTPPDPNPPGDNPGPYPPGTTIPAYPPAPPPTPDPPPPLPPPVVPPIDPLPPPGPTPPPDDGGGDLGGGDLGGGGGGGGDIGIGPDEELVA